MRPPRFVLVLFCLWLGACVTPVWELRKEEEKLFLQTGDGRYRTRVPDGLQTYSFGSDTAEFCGAVPKQGGWLQLAGRPEFARMPDVLRVGAYEARDEPLTHEQAERWIAARKEKREHGYAVRPDPPVIEELAIERATVAGAPASRIHWKEREPSGLRIEYLAYVVRLDERVFVFERAAPALVYFERFVPHLEQLVAGFEVVPP